MAPIGRAGSLGEISLDEAERRIRSALGLDDATLAELMRESGASTWGRSTRRWRRTLRRCEAGRPR
jgi:hypothetical protein